MRGTLHFYIKKINKYLQNHLLINISIGVFCGVVIGIISFILLQIEIPGIIILLLSAFLGVFAEVLIEFFGKMLQLRQQIRPLHRFWLS